MLRHVFDAEELLPRAAPTMQDHISAIGTGDADDTAMYCALFGRRNGHVAGLQVVGLLLHAQHAVAGLCIDHAFLNLGQLLIGQAQALGVGLGERHTGDDLVDACRMLRQAAVNSCHDSLEHRQIAPVERHVKHDDTRDGRIEPLPDFPAELASHGGADQDDTRESVTGLRLNLLDGIVDDCRRIELLTVVDGQNFPKPFEVRADWLEELVAFGAESGQDDGQDVAVARVAGELRCGQCVLGFCGRHEGSYQ